MLPIFVSLPCVPQVNSSLHEHQFNQEVTGLASDSSAHKNGVKLDFSTVKMAQMPTPKETPRGDLPPVEEQNSQPLTIEESPQKEQNQEKIKPELEIEVRKKLVNSLLDNAAIKYPYVVNTTDNFIIKPNLYKPQDFNTYSDFELRFDGNIIDSNPRIPIINSGTISKFNDGFYWILDGNRMVVETSGNHAGLRYQGYSSETDYLQIARSGTNFWGVQTAWAFPPILSQLIGKAERESLENMRFSTVSLEVIAPEGVDISKSQVTFKGIIPGSDLAISFDDISKADTWSINGGGAFFENLDSDNAPLFLQGFKTVNLKGLLDNGVSLKNGSIIPPENLAKIGLTWGDFFTGKGFSYTPNFASENKKFPKLQTLRLGDDVNNDLVSILSNPFLSESEYNLHYLNSLDWVNFGPQNIQVENINKTIEEKDWYRFVYGYSHNRSLLYYHPEKIQLNYTNIFANPGVSFTVNNFDKVDKKQTLIASLGLMLGGMFELLNSNNLQESLDEAKQINQELKPISFLQTKATSEQRRLMNSRLNLSLNNTSNFSSLAQVSGSFTFASKITPDDSFLLQIRAGLKERSVQFYENNFADWSPETPTYLTSVRPPNLGPLTYTGINFPINKTEIEPPKNVFQTVALIISTPEEVTVKNIATIEPNIFTAVPFPSPTRAADIEFGLWELSRFRHRNVEENLYLGRLYLPALELLLSGSHNNINYGFSTTTWYNFWPNSAPSVEQNMTDLSWINSEPSLGFSAKGYLDVMFRDYANFDDKKIPQTTLLQLPSFSFDWNSSPNNLNTSTANLGYFLLLKKPNWSLHFSSNLVYTPQGLNNLVKQTNQGDLGVFLSGGFSTNSGLNTRVFLNFGNDIFTELSATYKIISNPHFGDLSLGAYYRNSTSLTRGLGTTISDTAYGSIIDYTHPHTNINIHTELGVNDRGFDGKLRLGFKMKL